MEHYLNRLVFFCYSVILMSPIEKAECRSSYATAMDASKWLSSTGKRVFVFSNHQGASRLLQ